MATREWNPEQLKAITAFGGNIIVSAAAGSGKTAVLVERVIRMLTAKENPVDADRLLITTFTNAAAAEMKARISAALSELIAKNPNDEGLRRQQLLMERAHISTISSFCYDVVKENFNALGIPSDTRIVTEQERTEISSAAVSEALEDAYQKGDPVFFELSETLGGGRSDIGLESCVLTLYDFIRALPYYKDWLSEKAAMYDPEIPLSETAWGKIITERAVCVLKHCAARAEYMRDFCLEEGNDRYASMFAEDYLMLNEVLRICEHESWNRAQNVIENTVFSRMSSIRGVDEVLKEKVKLARDGYKKDFSGLNKLFSATEEEFREDIADLYPKICCLFDITMDYDRLYAQKKQERNAVDFSDMEQFALSVLTEKDGNGKIIPTAAAKSLAACFDYILVDECQDINKVHDTIFFSVSKGDNLFFVGDVKQSIYRFRQAMPELFLEKRRSWAPFDGKHFPASIVLGRNYRSRKSVAGAVNFIFEQIMSTETAGMDYGEEEKLIAEASFPEDGIIRNEGIIIECGDESVAKSEAAVVARRIYDMVQSKMPVSSKEGVRPIEYSDICILLRYTNNQGPAFADALRNFGINYSYGKDGGLYSRPEVAAVLNVLKAADNPLLDIPLAGAMLSEIFAFTPEELAKIRLLGRNIPLYSAVKLAAEGGGEKEADFLRLLSEIRRAAAAESSDSVIELFYRLTSYPQIMRACKDGEMRLANLRLLVKQAADCEDAGFHGLSAFLRFVSRAEAGGIDVPTAGCSGFGSNCVHIMSVHNSKGLEFPVVFLSGTARKFRLDNGSVTLHSELGFACARRDKNTGIRFSTVPQEALRLKAHQTSVEEEMCILYVALTRAKENLIVTCAVKNAEKYLSSLAQSVGEERVMDPFFVSGSEKESDWIFSALLRHPDAANLRTVAGLTESAVLPDETRWSFCITAPPSEKAFAEETAAEAAAPEPDPEITNALLANTGWEYPFAAAQTIPAKAGVSALTHGEMHKKLLFSAEPQSGSLSGAARGTALHTFMQFCDFALAKSDPKAEIERLEKLDFITQKQAASINPEKVRAFFESELYLLIESSPWVKRELRFLQSLPAAELGYENAAPEDKITVQGVADCVFESGGKLYILDYKTDFVEDIEELRLRYAAQLHMYRLLLSASLGKPVEGSVIWSFRFGRELWV